MVRVFSGLRARDDSDPKNGHRAPELEGAMIRRLSISSDPFEGRHAKRRHLRIKIEGLLALAMAIVACGLTAAVWIQLLAPLGKVLGLS